jgi:radical SAM superfamily enzyme YgiQ (UPF0313 family)
MKKKILIVQPSHYRSKENRAVFKTKRRHVVSLTLPYLAALTPSDWDVQLIDEQVQDIDFDTPADLVALTAWTVHSYRAYDVAAEFRKRNVPVVMGGPHAFFHPEEASNHCDAVGIGEAEPIWQQILNDAAAGRLQKFYRAAPLEDLQGLPRPRFDMVNQKHYSAMRTYTLQSSRGCPFSCEFCSERLYLGAGFRNRPVEDVVADIRHTGSKNILFGESNFGGKRDKAMQLMEAMIPLKVRWSALWSSYLCNDDEYMDLAKRSGLLHVNIGIESIMPDTLGGMNKKFNKVHKYDEMVAKLNKRGISFSLNFIFGWDGESPETFRATLEFLHRTKVPVAYFNILTPYKGTKLYDDMLAAGKILNPAEIDRWPGQKCYIRPPYGTPEEMEAKIKEMYRDFYSVGSILKRLPMPVTPANIASWFVNISERRMAFAANGHNDFDNY